MGCVKGTAWLSTLEYLKATYGADGIQRVIATLGPEEQKILTKPILPITWLDYQVFMNFMLAADKVLAKGDMELVRTASVACAQQDLRGIYRMFISFTTPSFSINNAGRLWRQYYDRGVLTLEYLKGKTGALRLVDYPEIPLHHEIDQTAFMIEALRLSRGGKNVRGAHPKCIARGDAYCLFEFAWD